MYFTTKTPVLILVDVSADSRGQDFIPLLRTEVSYTVCYVLKTIYYSVSVDEQLNTFFI